MIRWRMKMLKVWFRLNLHSSSWFIINSSGRDIPQHKWRLIYLIKSTRVAEKGEIAHNPIITDTYVHNTNHSVSSLLNIIQNCTIWFYIVLATIPIRNCAQNVPSIERQVSLSWKDSLQLKWWFRSIFADLRDLFREYIWTLWNQPTAAMAVAIRAMAATVTWTL